jgi:cytochrome P450 / NADPH-cytochrome P450 reductase
VCAFSREPGKPKTYVQQAIAVNGDAVWELLQKGAPVFVCGEAARMAPDVKQAFVDLFCKSTPAPPPLTARRGLRGSSRATDI